MPTPEPITNIRMNIARVQYRAKEFWNTVWPVKWDIFKQPKVLWSAFSVAPYAIKAVFTVSTVILVLASSMMGYGLYMSSTWLILLLLI